MAIEVEFLAGGTRFERVGRMRVVPLAPFPSDDTGRLDATGLWVEVRDAQNKVLYRRILHDSGDTIEGPGDTLGSFVRVATGQRPPLYVVVPQIPGGRVVLVSSERPGDRALDSVEATLPGVV